VPVRFRTLAVRLAILLVLIAAASPARAELIRITPVGVTVAQQDATGFTDPVPIGGDGFRLTYHGGGPTHIIDPLELIIGIPVEHLGDPVSTTPPLSNDANSGFTSIGIDVGDTATRYGGSWNTTTGYAGRFTTGKVYAFIGFNPDASDSENYSNWSGVGGFSMWDLFVFSLRFDPDMTHGSWAEFDTNLPGGSYVVGYGCTKINSSGLCKNEGATESTPFTFAGNVTNVPEPASLSLLLLGAGLLAARRRPRASAGQPRE